MCIDGNTLDQLPEDGNLTQLRVIAIDSPTLHYGLIILAMVYSMAPSGPFNVACTIIIQTIYLATTVYLALHSII